MCVCVCASLFDVPVIIRIVWSFSATEHASFSLKISSTHTNIVSPIIRDVLTRRGDGPMGDFTVRVSITISPLSRFASRSLIYARLA